MLRSRLLRPPRVPLPALPRLRWVPGARSPARRRQPDRWVEVDDGTRLAAWVTGPSDPVATVVLVHGWTQAAAAWDRAVARLTAEHPSVSVVRFDLRGHGSSRPSLARTPGGRGGAVAASVRRLGDDLSQVVAQLAPAGPLVLAGHSMGGMAVISAAGRHPGLLRGRGCGVLLCSTSAGGLAAAGRSVAPLMTALAALPPGVLVPRAPRVIAQRASYGPLTDPALVRETLRAIGPVSGRSTGEWFAALMAHDETAALPALAAAGVPVRVLVGDADRLTPLAHARTLAEALPGAALTVVPGAGHMLFVERPDVVAAAVGELLEHATRPPVG